MRDKKIVLTIAGFDPSSGAGLTADIRTFENIGVYGMATCTAITVQNAEKVESWKPVDIELIRSQLEIILSSYDINYVKVGMLGTPEVIKLVAEFQEKYNFKLVLDPILVSGSGMELTQNFDNSDISDKDTATSAKETVASAKETAFSTETGSDNEYIQTLINYLLPKTYLIIPNRIEAETLVNMNITDLQSVNEVGNKILELGAKNVIIKGGHIDENGVDVIDYLINDDYFKFYPRQREFVPENKHIHGTGCVFSSLVTGFLALGYDLEECIFFSEDFMEKTLENIFPLKKGMVLDVGYNAEEVDVLKAVQKISDFICGNKEYTKFIPEVRTNISVSKRDAKSLKDIAAIDGRITVVSGIPVQSGPIKFGVSNHTGRLLLAAKKLDASTNVVVNVKYAPETILKLSKETNFSMIDVDRLKQGAETSSSEGNTMEWLVNSAYKKMNKIPDIIWDKGEPGKEPMLRVFARDSEDMLKKLRVIINLMK